MRNGKDMHQTYFRYESRTEVRGQQTARSGMRQAVRVLEKQIRLEAETDSPSRRSTQGDSGQRSIRLMLRCLRFCRSKRKWRGKDERAFGASGPDHGRRFVYWVGQRPDARARGC